MHVQAAFRLLGQEFGINNISYVSHTTFYLHERKTFEIAFTAFQ
jgi:hypothetical protein